MVDLIRTAMERGLPALIDAVLECRDQYGAVENAVESVDLDTAVELYNALTDAVRVFELPPAVSVDVQQYRWAWMYLDGLVAAARARLIRLAFPAVPEVVRDIARDALNGDGDARHALLHALARP